ncbi:MAG: macro domain-containing protein [Armatimonadetes bacterium]|nr:macro domain-containing protein [Armatimonadota bacterium]
MSEVLRQRTLAGGCELLICRGDLTAEPVAAIVNAANSHLAHGGGVAGAIARRGGAVIQSDSDAWVRAHGPVPTGQAALTPAGALPCRAVIHAVGPVWRGGSHGEREDLASAVRSALVLAAEHELETVALPAISSGIFGFPKELCAEILISTVVECDAANPGGLPRAVRLTNLDDLTVGILADEFDRRWPRL